MIKRIMRMRSAIAILLFALAGALACFAQPGQVSSLEPGLRDAIVRDASCTPQPAARIADDPSAHFLLSHVRLQTFRGAHPGSIVVLDGACHCSEGGSEGGADHGNCATYVYLRSGDTYRLALHGILASLRPLKGSRHGMPSLAARFEADDSKTETVIFEWTGAEYSPTLCASTVQSTGKRRAVIVKHDCANSPAIAAQ